MKLLIDILKSTWYLWALMIAVSILKIFLPRIKGYFGEKSVAFFLSRLDPAKYKVINNIMLQIGVYLLLKLKTIRAGF